MGDLSDRSRDDFGRLLPMAGTSGEPGGERPKPKPKPKPKAQRSGRGTAGGSIGWTKPKEAVFFRELAMVCNVSAALRRAKLGGCSAMAYERRKTDARFRAAWEDAIDQSYAMLELEMLERVRFGDDRPPPATEAERKLRAIPTSLALQLLKLYENRVKARASAPAKAPVRLTRERGDALRKRIEQKLSDFNRRMGGKG